jgi:hypothetical protein
MMILIPRTQRIHENQRDMTQTRTILGLEDKRGVNDNLVMFSNVLWGWYMYLSLQIGWCSTSIYLITIRFPLREPTRSEATLEASLTVGHTYNRPMFDFPIFREPHFPKTTTILYCKFKKCQMIHNCAS